jgi:Phage integrase family.
MVILSRGVVVRPQVRQNRPETRSFAPVLPAPDPGFWLDTAEADQLINAARDRVERIAFRLGLRSGLRVSEIVSVRARDIVDTSAGPRVRVWDSKGDEYRETPTTHDILAAAETIADLEDHNTKLVPHGTRWVQRHLDDVTSELVEHDEMWSKVTPHDLRRSWATLLSADIDDPLLIMDFGGWSDMDTFLEHYRGSYSPQVQRRELKKVDWLNVGSRQTSDRVPELQQLEQA